MARTRRKLPQINASSMADIAFLLLIFFLITTSMDTDKGLARRLPPPIPPEQENQDIDIKDRNVLKILLNSSNQLMVEDKPTQLKDLRKITKEFIANPKDDPNLPEKTLMDVEGIGRIYITKNHVISLQNDRGTEYQAYINVQNEIAAAYNELRDELSERLYNKRFDELSEIRRKAVQAVYPQKISEAEPKNYGVEAK